MKCESCKFWDQDIEYPNLGFCHRSAPRSVISQPGEAVLSVDVSWPRTKEDEWCGEWSAKLEIEEGE
ncbi:MAG: hypothetical protein PVG99_14405 [Desulfobacteraceae bacterium]